jgi:23S rRNA (cytidine1920-2'-O)/16S rRNA (cytidine1409-2'-O)-methyltransferase
MPSMRLDQALVNRGLVESRTKAQRRIDAGEVSVDGVTQTKHALPVGEESAIELHGGADYVGRGALKLLTSVRQRAGSPRFSSSEGQRELLPLMWDTVNYTQALSPTSA